MKNLNKKSIIPLLVKEKRNKHQPWQERKRQKNHHKQKTWQPSFIFYSNKKKNKEKWWQVVHGKHKKHRKMATKNDYLLLFSPWDPPVLLQPERSVSMPQAWGSFMRSSLDKPMEWRREGLLKKLHRHCELLSCISFKGAQQVSGGLVWDFMYDWHGRSFCMHCASCRKLPCPSPGRSWSRVLWHKPTWRYDDKNMAMRMNERGPMLEAIFFIKERENSGWNSTNQPNLVFTLLLFFSLFPLSLILVYCNSI